MLPAHFLDLYDRLLQSTANFPTWPNNGLSAHAPLAGESWKAGGVVFYGRAQNGWVETARFEHKDLTDSRARAEKARAICEVGYGIPICEFDTRAGGRWVVAVAVDCIGYTTHAKGTEPIPLVTRLGTLRPAAHFGESWVVLRAIYIPNWLWTSGLPRSPGAIYTKWHQVAAVIRIENSESANSTPV